MRAVQGNVRIRFQPDLAFGESLDSAKATQGRPTEPGAWSAARFISSHCRYHRERVPQRPRWPSPARPVEEDADADIRAKAIVTRVISCVPPRRVPYVTSTTPQETVCLISVRESRARPQDHLIASGVHFAGRRCAHSWYVLRTCGTTGRGEEPGRRGGYQHLFHAADRRPVGGGDVGRESLN